MFTILYSILFIIFFLLGCFIGKKYQEQFFHNKKAISLSAPPVSPSSLSIELSKQYDTIGEVSKGASYIGILENRIDLVLIKDSAVLSEQEQLLKKLITENQVFLRVIVQAKES